TATTDAQVASSETVLDNGAAVAVASSAKSGSSAQETTADAASSTEANASAAASSSPSLLIDALRSTSTNDPFADLIQSSGENADAAIDPALQAGKLSDSGPL